MIKLTKLNCVADSIYVRKEDIIRVEEIGYNSVVYFKDGSDIEVYESGDEIMDLLDE